VSTSVARQLRKQPTQAELRLWSRLRRRQVDGHRFRRQIPFGRYVADFLCLEMRLIIEVDGGQHDASSAQDGARTRWFEAQGFTVIRFWNNDVLGNTAGVIQAIQMALSELRSHTTKGDIA
jgi:very-short-patch-repair endonuclease